MAKTTETSDIKANIKADLNDLAATVGSWIRGSVSRWVWGVWLMFAANADAVPSSEGERWLLPALFIYLPPLLYGGWLQMTGVRTLKWIWVALAPWIVGLFDIVILNAARILIEGYTHTGTVYFFQLEVDTALFDIWTGRSLGYAILIGVGWAVGWVGPELWAARSWRRHSDAPPPGGWGTEEDA